MPKNNQNTKSSKKRMCLAAIIALLAALIGYHLLTRQSTEEQLAAIEAARAIPDSENAAVIYNKLMQDLNAMASPHVWSEEKQPVIDALLKASEFDKCRFPIEIPFPALDTMRDCAFLLREAANEDIANDRIDDAIEKWRCLLMIGNHLRQQPLFTELLLAMAIEAIALNQANAFLVQDSPDETHLRRIESLSLCTRGNWKPTLEEIAPAESLAMKVYKDRMGFVERIMYCLGRDYLGPMEYPDTAKMRRHYHELLARARGLRVLVALRRYKNKHGRWPENLDQIKSQLPEEVFLDPFGNTLAYKVTNDNLTLYSKGPNKIDENGERRNGADDCPIWMPETPKKMEETADDK